MRIQKIKWQVTLWHGSLKIENVIFIIMWDSIKRGKKIMELDYKIIERIE